MKKRLFVMAMTSVALVGCVSNELEDVTQVKEPVMVGFESPVLYDNVDSRVVTGEIGSHSYGNKVYSYPQEEQFTLFGVSHTGSFAGWNDEKNTTFFDKVNVAYKKEKFDAWVPLKSDNSYYYWPDNANLTYAAVSPAGLVCTDKNYGNTGLNITGFKVERHPLDQYDVLFSKREVNKSHQDMDVTNPDTYSGLPITFQHALSCVRFAILKDQNVESTITLTGLNIRGIYDTGDFKENITENQSDYTQYVRNTNVNPEWDINDEVDAVNYHAFKGSVEFGYSAQSISTLIPEDELNRESNYSCPLLLLPQALTSDAILDITYEVGTGTEKETKTKSVTLNTYPSNTPISAWEVGKRYTYIIHYSLAAAKNDIIFFAPSTEGWLTDTNIEIIL